MEIIDNEYKCPYCANSLKDEVKYHLTRQRQEFIDEILKALPPNLINNIKYEKI